MVQYYRTLGPGQQLNAGDWLFSGTRAFALTMQGDGNLVLYNINYNSFTGPGDINQATYNTAVWDAKTTGLGATVCIMQNDGNLVLYAPGGTAIWDSSTGGNPGATLVCQDDGNLVIYVNNLTKAIWWTNTGAGYCPGRAPPPGSGGGVLPQPFIITAVYYQPYDAPFTGLQFSVQSSGQIPPQNENPKGTYRVNVPPGTTLTLSPASATETTGLQIVSSNGAPTSQLIGPTTVGGTAKIFLSGYPPI